MINPTRAARWLVFFCLLLLGSAATASATPKQVVINSPVDGRVSSSPFESPPHHVIYGQWSFDIHTFGQARPVYARFGATNGNLRLRVVERVNTSCRSGGGGWRVQVRAWVDGVLVGDVFYLHLANAHPEGDIANGTQIGTTALGASDNPNCWTGPHIHVEGINRSGSASCARRINIGTDLGAGSAIGVIGGDWAGANNQACPDAAFNVGPGGGGGGGSGNGNPIGHFDELRRHPGGVWVRGWIVDPDSTASTAVHVYAGTGGVSSSNPSVALTANLHRADVAAAIGKGPLHGFSGFLRLSAGRHIVCIYGINIPGTPGGNPQIQCRVIDVSPEPFGHLDGVRRAPGGIAGSGWALDPDTDAPIGVHLYSGTGQLGVGNPGTAHHANKSRPDIPGAHPGFSTNHGFDGVVPAGPGKQTVCAYAINAAGTLGQHRQIGCKSMNVSPEPFGALESVTRDGNILTARGWAIDPDTDSPIAVHLYAGDGNIRAGGGHSTTANQSHAEAARKNPGWSASHGFTGRATSLTRPEKVCAYAINAAGTPGGNQPIGCISEANFLIAPPPAAAPPPPAGQGSVTPPPTAAPPPAAPSAPVALPRATRSAVNAKPKALRKARLRTAKVIRRGHRYRIGIGATPGRAYAGRRVLVQRKVGSRYRAVTTTKVQRNGRVRAIVTLDRRKRGLLGARGVNRITLRLALPKQNGRVGRIGPVRAISMRTK